MNLKAQNDLMAIIKLRNQIRDNNFPPPAHVNSQVDEVVAKGEAYLVRAGGWYCYPFVSLENAKAKMKDLANEGIINVRICLPDGDSLYPDSEAMS